MSQAGPEKLSIQEHFKRFFAWSGNVLDKELHTSSVDEGVMIVCH